MQQNLLENKTCNTTYWKISNMQHHILEHINMKYNIFRYINHATQLTGEHKNAEEHTGEHKTCNTTYWRT
jgi:hypothetical protein